MNHVERFRALMAFQPVDRLPRWEWALWWDLTIGRWHSEGRPSLYPDHCAAIAAMVPWARRQAEGEAVVWITLDRINQPFGFQISDCSTTSAATVRPLS
jgi:hypothetical protein